MNFRDWLFSEEEERKLSIPESAIKVHLPKVLQQTNYSCGAAAFRAICDYFRVKTGPESHFMSMLNTNTKHGTDHKTLITAGKTLGLTVQAKENMSVEELCDYLDKKVPVLCALQAWGTPKQYKKGDFGHYVVAIGYDPHNLYFEDPSLEGGKRGFVNKENFVKRWHDKDAQGNKVNKLGIAFWKASAKPERGIKMAKKIE